MKLPRWLVSSLLSLSLLATLAATVWWWICWPERTLLQFLSLIGEGKFESTNEMLHNAEWRVLDVDDYRGDNKLVRDVELKLNRSQKAKPLVCFGSDEKWRRVLHADLHRKTRTYWDIIEGRTRFEIEQPSDWLIGLTVQRGRITCEVAEVR